MKNRNWSRSGIQQTTTWRDTDDFSTDAAMTQNTEMTCPQCGNKFTQRIYKVGENYLCQVVCADRYARAEVVRLRGWLSHIKVKTRGMGSDLAGIALNTNQTSWRKAKD